MSAKAQDLVPGRGPFRVAMVAASPFPYPQGSQVLVSQLAEALQRHGHKVSMVAYHHGTGPEPVGVQIERIRSFPGAGTVTAGPSWQKPVLDIALARRLLKLVREQAIDVMHAHNIEGLVAALVVRRATGVPVIYHIHNAMGLELHTYFQNRGARWAAGMAGKWADAHLPQQADGCLALTGRAQAYFQALGVDRIRIAPPGITYEEGSADRGRAAIGTAPTVLYSGNLDTYQDIDLLFHAFRLVLASQPAARLVLSTNSDSSRYLATAQDLAAEGQVEFRQAGDFGSVRDLLAATDVAVCPRVRCLGFPIKLLNYMAAARPIVVSEGTASGLRHMENAWVVANGDAEGMATAIVALLEDVPLARRLGEAARRTARRDYAWDRTVGAVVDAYAEALAV